MRDLDVDLEAPITLKSLGILRREPQWSVSNQILDSYEDARSELALAKRLGIKAVLEPAAIGIGRLPLALRKLGRELDMHLITGTGYYRQAFHPPEVAGMSVAQVEERFLRELTLGMDDTDVRAGLIGELGTTGGAILPDEEKVLTAAGRVQRQTNVLVMVHTSGQRDVVLEAIRILTANGASPHKIHICHINEAPWWQEIVDTGATVGLDCFGSTFSVDSEIAMNPNDQTRIDQLRRIFDAGCGSKVLVSNDICMKMRLHKYGGWGYDHIQTNLTPHMKRAGFTDADFHLLFVENPRRLLDTET
jgi:phosphotriesterase-related protein